MPQDDERHGLTVEVDAASYAAVEQRSIDAHLARRRSIREVALQRRGSLWRMFSNVLVWARIMTAITSIGEGYSGSVICGALVLLSQDIVTSPAQKGLMIAFGPLGAALGGTLGTAVADTCGRRPGLIFAYVLLCAGSSVLALAQNAWMVMIGRLLDGLSCGAGITITTTYMAEVTPATSRGYFVNLEGMFLNVGVLGGFVANCALLNFAHNWRIMFAINAIPPFIAGILLVIGIIPESPRFTMAQGSRRPSALVAFVGEHEAAETCAKKHSPIGSWLDLGSCTRAELKAVSAGVLVMCSQAISGVGLIGAYATTLFTKLHMSVHDATLAVLLAGIVAFCCSLLGTFLIDEIGRRPLMLPSILGCTIGHAATGFIYIQSLSAMPWLFGTMCLIQGAFGFGLGGAGFTYAGELFPTKFRTKGMSMGYIVSRMYTAILLFVFLPAAEKYGFGVCFLLVAATNVPSIAMIYIMPETTGLMLEDINELFEHAEPEGIPS